mmetsp:Transcript_12488/g.30301  ORF Transcript_12488/g.30301 Transcript_12488/m.30301 type:complete len:315 (-) Transcript_12488:114-1058(-)
MRARPLPRRSSACSVAASVLLFPSSGPTFLIAFSAAERIRSERRRAMPSRAVPSSDSRFPSRFRIRSDTHPSRPVGSAVRWLPKHHSPSRDTSLERSGNTERQLEPTSSFCKAVARLRVEGRASRWLFRAHSSSRDAHWLKSASGRRLIGFPLMLSTRSALHPPMLSGSPSSRLRATLSSLNASNLPSPGGSAERLLSSSVSTCSRTSCTTDASRVPWSKLCSNRRHSRRGTQLSRSSGRHERRFLARLSTCRCGRRPSVGTSVRSLRSRRSDSNSPRAPSPRSSAALAHAVATPADPRASPSAVATDSGPDSG